MAQATFYYKKKLTANTSEQKHEFNKRLRGFHVMNHGTVNVTVEFENSISADSIIIPPRSQITIGTDMQDMRYKAASSTAVLYIYGLKHEKD